MTCRIQARESPQIDSVKLLLSAKFDCLFKQHFPDAIPLAFRRNDEPSQVDPSVIVIDPIDGDGAHNFFFNACYPKPIARFIKTPQKLRKL